MIFLFSLAAQLSRWASRFTNRIRAMNSARLKLLVFLTSAAALSSLWAIIPDRFFFSTSWDYDNAYKPLADTILNGHPFIWMGTPAFVKDPSQTFSFPPRYSRPALSARLSSADRCDLAAAEKLNIPEPAAIYILNLVATAICAVCLFSIAAAVFGRIRSDSSAFVDHLSPAAADDQGAGLRNPVLRITICGDRARMDRAQLTPPAGCGIFWRRTAARLRDAGAGAGNRSGARSCRRHLGAFCENSPRGFG